VFEIIYYTAVRESAEMARTDGACEAHAGSPASEGRLSPDLWGVNAVDFVSGGYLNWDDLRAYVREHGMRNTLLVALMPTATTSIIMGSCAESIEPVYSHIYTRRLLSGETICVNRHLQSHLKKLGLWSSEMLAKIIAHNGLIGSIEEIPADVRHLFRTVWEISLRCVYVCVHAERACEPLDGLPQPLGNAGSNSCSQRTARRSSTKASRRTCSCASPTSAS